MITSRSGEIKAGLKYYFKKFQYAKNTAVRPHKGSDANLKRLRSAASVSANPNEVRVRPHNRSDAELNAA